MMLIMVTSFSSSVLSLSLSKSYLRSHVLVSASFKSFPLLQFGKGVVGWEFKGFDSALYYFRKGKKTLVNVLANSDVNKRALKARAPRIPPPPNRNWEREEERGEREREKENGSIIRRCNPFHYLSNKWPRSFTPSFHPPATCPPLPNVAHNVY